MSELSSTDFKGASQAHGLVWDIPTRLFHWVTALAFGGAWLTSGDSRDLYIHVFTGYLFSGLVAFRLLWGIWGSHHSRFSTFAYNANTAKNYITDLLNNRARRYIGHNPAGSWAIFFMLFAGIILIVAGLVTLGANEHAGPLAGLGDYAVGDTASELHEAVAWALLFWLGIHVTGVLVESVAHREKLILSMLNGHKPGTPDQPDTRPHRGLALLMVAVMGSAAAVYFQGYLTTDKTPFTPYTGPALAADAGWTSECKDCHIAYHPSLLPARSWERMFAEQDHHFGEDLALDEDTIGELKSFALRNSAEQHATKAAWQLDHTIPKQDRTLRITETAYWKSQHDEIAPDVWRREKIKSKANCDACHRDAKEGTFRPAAMTVPN